MSRPIMANFNRSHVKFEWDGADPYPVKVAIKMEDNTVIEFVRDEKQPHPCFVKAMNIIRGYPPRGKHERKESNETDL